MSTWDPCHAYRAQDVARAEAPLTAGTDRFMRAAAAAVTARCTKLLGHRQGRSVLVLSGGGHNGADALLAGADLSRNGAQVRAVLVSQHVLPPVRQEAEDSGVLMLDATEPEAEDLLAQARRGTVDLVVDGLTGLGAKGPLRGEALTLVVSLSAAGEPGQRPFTVVAVDCPSGVGVDDGRVDGPVLAADATVTFTCLKGAHVLPPAAVLCGDTTVTDLGLPVPPDPPLAWRPSDSRLAGLLRVPGAQDHKYTRGVVRAVVGSQAYPGAAVLAVTGALRAGASMVRLSAPRRVQDLVLASRPEVVLAEGRCQAWLLGCGTDPQDAERVPQIRAALAQALADELPAVIDAGALPLLAETLAVCGRCRAQHVLTPHAGEAAALLSVLGKTTTRQEVESHPAEALRQLVERTGATVLLKASPTLVAGPDTTEIISVGSGPGWLATAGSGDVLAGVLAAVLASRQADQEHRHGSHDGTVACCAALAARIHAVAGARASGSVSGKHVGHPVVALDVAEKVGEAVSHLRAPGAGSDVGPWRWDNQHREPRS